MKVFRLTHRSGFLIPFGVVYGLIGWSYLSLTSAQRAAVSASLKPALHVAHWTTLTFYGWVWLGCGIACLISGLFSPGRKPIGFSIATMLPMAWAVISVWAWLSGAQPRGWVGGAVYLALAVGVANRAGATDPPKPEAKT